MVCADPHQIATYYSMYRTARNHDKIKTQQSWQWYLERAANTTLRLPPAHIGYMDGTVFREVLRSVLEENETANAAAAAAAVAPASDTLDDSTRSGADNRWDELGTKLLAGQQSRATFWSTAMWPYGSEFSYDTTGQEEVRKVRIVLLWCPACLVCLRALCDDRIHLQGRILS